MTNQSWSNKLTGKPGTAALLIRTALGALLIVKAIRFVQQTAVPAVLMGDGNGSLFTFKEALVVAIAAALTVVCGLLIIPGRFTRVAAFIALPVVLLGLMLYMAGIYSLTGFNL